MFYENLTIKSHKNYIKQCFKDIREAYNLFIEVEYNDKEYYYRKNHREVPTNLREKLRKKFFKHLKDEKIHFKNFDLYLETLDFIRFNLREIEHYRKKLLYIKQDNIEYFDKYKSSKVKLKFQTNEKNKKLDRLFDIYKKELEYRLSKNRNKSKKELKLKSSKDIPEKYIKNSRYKEIIYKHSINLLKKKENSIDKFSITFDFRFFKIIEKEKSGKIFDFIKLKLPFRNYRYKNRYETILIPFKITKHMKKLIKRGYNPINCIRLYKNNSGYYISFTYHKNTTKDYMKKVWVGKDKGLGINIDFENFLTLSDGKIISTDINKYVDIKRKKKNSKNFNNLKKEIQKEVYEKLKSINLSKYSHVIVDNYSVNGYIEDFGNNTDKFRRWTLDYERKLKDLCQENGVLLVKNSKVFTKTIKCPKCGKSHYMNLQDIHEANKKGFTCAYCNYYYLPNVEKAKNMVNDNIAQRIHNTFARQKRTEQNSKNKYKVKYEFYKVVNSFKWTFNKPVFVLDKFVDKLIEEDKYFNNTYFQNQIKHIYKQKSS